MREPNMRRAQSFAQASSASQPHKGRKLSVSLPLFRVLGISTAIICGSISLACAQEAAGSQTRPAVMSLESSTSLLLDSARAGDRLVAVGVRGHIIYSDDQGETWIQAKVPVRQLLAAVHFVDDRNGWAVGHDSLILHSSDAGESWTIQHRDPDLAEAPDADAGGLLEKPLMDVWFRNADEGFAVGAYGLALHTRDGGRTWDDISFDIDNPDGMHYNAITEIKDAGLFLVGEMGTMYRSADMGGSWETIQDLPYDGSWFGVSGTGEANGVLAWGLRGNLFRSDDFGNNWQQVELTTPSNGPLESTLAGGGLTANGDIVIVGTGGVTATSDDGGRTFEVNIRPDRVSLASATMTGDGHLLLLGQRGAIKTPATGSSTNNN